MEKLKVDSDWIRAHLPADMSDILPQDKVEKAMDLGRYFIDGTDIMCEGDRGGMSKVYIFKDEEDLHFWEFEKVCLRIGLASELHYRMENKCKWRYLQDHAENGHWMYIEQKDYFYNTIEDTRLVYFETFLRLTKPVLLSARWEELVGHYEPLMNRWFKVPHWGYDRENLCFIEISDSRPYRSDFDDTEEPEPSQILGVE